VSDRAHREAIRTMKSGNLQGARALTQAAFGRMSSWESKDALVMAELGALSALESELASGPMPSPRSNDVYFPRPSRSSGYRDLRASFRTPEEREQHLSRLLAGYIKTHAPWPKALDIAAISPEVLRDRYRGALLWGAAGDALGRPAEGLAPAELRAR